MELIAAFRRAELLASMLVVCVLTAAGVESIVGFRDEVAAVWTTWCGELTSQALG